MSDGSTRLTFHCPGCGHSHVYITSWRTGASRQEPVWEFNGNLESPTFKPSLLYNGNPDPKFQNPAVPRCHLYVTNGQIQYLSDCSHALAGKTIPMEDVK